ncbi:hypothetical protein TBK1r_03470 [Stieleria magnilauensis]|uniref:Uncharacterized protein n=1 Tax=Stieleria magnilauensis TaxID=2527963 RepID=A0ABX5XKE1_9BACT|nr:hypothetical protein TBK1r_03470 [Planctomycetes bacterium TBK1r]
MTPPPYLYGGVLLLMLVRQRGSEVVKKEA